MTGIFHRQWWGLHGLMPLRKNPSQTEYSRPEKKREKKSKPNQNQNQSTNQPNKKHNSQQGRKDDQRPELAATWRIPA